MFQRPGPGPVGNVARRLIVTGSMGNLSCKKIYPIMGPDSTVLPTSKEFNSTIEDAVERPPHWKASCME